MGGLTSSLIFSGGKMGRKKKIIDSSDEKVIITPKKKVYRSKKCFLCGNLILTEEELILHKEKAYHVNECIQKKYANELEEADWQELAEFVKTHILGYGKEIKFDRGLALRLKGLRNGQFMTNKSTKIEASYPYKIIYYTFIIKSGEILNAFATTKFNSEFHRINYMMRIIESSVVDTLLDVRKKEKNDKKSEMIVVEAPIPQISPVEYKRKSKDVSPELNEYW